MTMKFNEETKRRRKKNEDDGKRFECRHMILNFRFILPLLLLFSFNFLRIIVILPKSKMYVIGSWINDIWHYEWRTRCLISSDESGNPVTAFIIAARWFWLFLLQSIAHFSCDSFFASLLSNMFRCVIGGRTQNGVFTKQLAFHFSKSK